MSLAEQNISSTRSMDSKAGDNVAAVRRLQKELMDLMMSKDKSVSAFPDGENLFRWVATIDGPKDTVFENLTYKMTITFGPKYPFSPPTVKFLNHCFHPNIHANGEICLDILKEQWSALYDVRSILLSIQSLLGEPNLGSPLDIDAARMWGNPEYRDQVIKKAKNKIV